MASKKQLKKGRPKKCGKCKKQKGSTNPKTPICKCGRPTVMTLEVIQRLEHAFSLSCSDVLACKFAGIALQTLYDYIAKNPEFSVRKETLKSNLALKAVANIAESIKNKNTDESKWYLERKVKSEYSPRVETTGADGEPLNQPTIDLSKLNDNELRSFAKLIEKSKSEPDQS